MSSGFNLLMGPLNIVMRSEATQVPQLNAQVFDWPVGGQAKMTQQSGHQGFGSVSASNRVSCSGVVVLTPR